MVQKDLMELLDLTKELHKQATTIDSKMENNEDGQLEALQEQFDKRQTIIGNLTESIGIEGFQWTSEDRDVIAELKVLEESLQPIINGLHQAFGKQMNRISKTKHMSQKYIGAYQNSGAGGSFIDKRK
ncbi:flagellar protein FliT [Paenisporosarcina sp.]|uniref:flagellar protein FliT n=1 Tax=Paenisporosarcina sp. TaxID=1932001 RepID=UPI003C781A6A